jgi:membrane associated rhomboid family serine protease
MFNQLPQVTKNIILLNIMFFLATFVLQTQGIDLTASLGAHVVNTPLFKPYQLVTHFFMHGGFFHILFNMYLFAILGAYLEHIWGPKRFFIFYIATAFGAFALYNIMGVYDVMQLKAMIIEQGFSISETDYLQQIVPPSLPMLRSHLRLWWEHPEQFSV